MESGIHTYRRLEADPAEWFDADEVGRAKSYQRPLTVTNAISLVVSAGLLVAIIGFQLAPWFADWVGAEAWPLRLLVVMVGLMLVYTLAELPIDIWTTFSHENKWGFNTQTPGGFAGDQLKGFVLGLVVQGPLVLALWWLIRSTEWWWLAGWGVFFAFSVLLAFLYPIVLMPLFNKFTPLEDEELEGRIRGLVDKTGQKVSGVQVMDASKRTTKDNAFFAGVGKSRRVVLFDNLLAQPAAVIGSVVAHELGHWRRRHVLRGIALGATTTLVTFLVLRAASGWDALLGWAGVESVGDPAALPLVLGVFFGMSSAFGLLRAWVSRAYERQADLDALELTGDYDAFIETMRGLATRNLSDLAPSVWHYVRASHPPAAERLQLAQRWREHQAALLR
jgi:STE24 endopeptidase